MSQEHAGDTIDGVIEGDEIESFHGRNDERARGTPARERDCVRPHVPLPRDGDRTRWNPHGQTSAVHEDQRMLSLKTFLMEGNENYQSNQPAATTYMNFSTTNRQPLRSPSALTAVFQETGQRPDSLPSAFFRKLSSTLRKQMSSPDLASVTTVTRQATKTGMGISSFMRKSKLSLDINAANAYDGVSIWEHSSLVPEVPAVKRETRPVATDRVSSLTLRPQSPSSCVDTYAGEPRTITIDRQNPRMCSIIPLTHQTMDTSASGSSRFQRTLMTLSSSSLEAQSGSPSPDFRSPSQPSGSTMGPSTVMNESRFPNGTGVVVKQSKKELKALEKKGRSQKEIEEIDALTQLRLRKETNTQIELCSPKDERCKHPNHQRKWNSKNIWCANHLSPGRCPRCNASCCTMMSLRNLLQCNSVEAIPLRENARRLQREISSYFVYGRDEDTFMECTECHELVCPSCCSVCPMKDCGDRVCNGPDCNPDGQWEKCSWHEEVDVD